ncbi:hypothetical protein GCM10007291_22540 [Gemmobacter nanjingensis]|uniref:Uncharacterized protein n=1 Tax=Gemmobacter nanjingensis TaxID=488454 RepID=A0ABQ3FFR0_9RHOB|nr:hypothetical protein [Gemmobacter nanjingensis]GHC22532.1 hypothetical protein GCM10007291_22540 [Gemmobacter nanjingensis]
MGWLRHEDGSLHYPAFELDELGRPLAVRIHLQSPAHLAPDETKILALQWAKAWLRIPGSINEALALADLDVAMSGRKTECTEGEAKILLTASRTLFRWHDAAQMQRTKRAFPWVEFVTIEGQKVCGKAAALNRRLLVFEDHPALPLSECDASECTCIYHQLTDGQRVRRCPDLG